MISDFAKFMSNNLFYILLINFVLILVFFIINRKDIAAQFKKIAKRTWLVFIIILILGSYLRFSSPGCSDMGGLCFGYVKTSTEMLETGHVSDLWHPKAYSLLMAAGFFFLGQNYSVVYYFNLVISSLTIFLVFLLAYVLFKRDDAALFSSLIYSLFPMSIIYAKLNASETTSVFFITLTVIIYLISISLNKRNLYFLFFLLVVFSLHVRTDASIFIPLFIAGFILNRKDIRLKELKVPFIVFLIFMLPTSYYFVVGDNIYGPSRDPHYNERPYTISPVYLIPNIEYNLSNNLLVSDYYPTILYLFLIFSLFFIPRERGIVYVALLAAGFFLLFGVWWMTIYSNTKLYQLALQPALAIMMGYGISMAKVYVEKFAETKLSLKIIYNVKYAGIFLILFLIILLFQTSANVFALKANDNCLIEDMIYSGNFIGGDDCLLFENAPSDFVSAPPADFMKILMPDKYLAISLSACGNKERYYLYVNQTVCRHSFFGTEKSIFNSLQDKYKMKTVEKKGCVILYKIEDK